MRAAVLRAPGSPMVIEPAHPDELAPEELLVELAGTGICHTDLAALDGIVPLPTPTVIGHEGAGVITQVGSAVREFAVGDHVVLSFDCCRQCDACTTGHPSYCELFAASNYFGARLDGSTTLRQGENEVHGSWFGQSSFATHAVASQRNAVKVDRNLPLHLLGPLGCGLLTGAGTVLNVLAPARGTAIGIWGIGAVGLAAVMAAKASGCTTIVAIDPNVKRLEMAAELGATHTLNPAATADLVWDVIQLTGGLHCSVDAVGSPTAVRQALEALRSPGTCATLGLKALENEVTIDQGHLLQGRALTGVIEGDSDPKVIVPQLIQYWQDGIFPFDRLIETYPFEQINDAIADFRAGRTIKPVVVFE